ncbi:hypothetical protein Fmac_028249 [Flemingia macrophylla]|uniref:Membrane protein of ER body-like protein n=1 Tax=Flemingia macrophylla TaxID=520843 RepID=A0ABD1L8E1_9FABA
MNYIAPAVRFASTRSYFAQHFLAHHLHLHLHLPSPSPSPSPQGNPEDEAPVLCCTCLSSLIEKGRGLFNGLVPGPAVPPASPPITGWEILKSIVYGGLAELLASLSVVTSAASADATTLSIFALGIANLIGGLSVLGHNLKDLRASQPREEGSSETNAGNDKYEELLGRRENFFLHAFVAILSFIIFGSVPPIVYGFSCRESDDKDLKLAAVAAASLICITLLAIAKAHIQKPNSYVTYLKTVAFYVTSGVLASLLAYVAGAFIKRLVEQLGWFETKSNFGLSLPEMSVVKSAGLRGSY